MNTITHRDGCEGPKHDPYSYDEYTLHTRLGTVTLHLGLAEYVIIELNDALKGVKLPLYHSEDRGIADETLRRLGFLPVKKIVKTYRRIKDANLRLHKRCGGSQWELGFPGESILFCKCGAVIDSQFNEGAII